MQINERTYQKTLKDDFMSEIQNEYIRKYGINSRNFYRAYALRHI